MNTSVPPATQAMHPVLFIPGVRKCGTTTLFDMLSRHSEITCPIMKEPQFFSLLPSAVQENLDWYAGLFPEEKGKMLMDASTLSFGNSHAASLIKKHFVSAKIVLLVRDPAKRAYSSFQHANKKSLRNDKRSFDEILSAMEKLVPQMSVAEAEDTLLQTAIDRGEVNEHLRGKDFLKNRYGANFATDMADPLFSYKYFQESQYHDKIEPFSQTFGDDVKIVFFEEFVSDPAGQLESILKFLDLDVEEEVLQASHKNKTITPKHELARQILHFQRTSKLAKRVTKTLKGWGLKSWGAGMRSRFLQSAAPKMTDSQYQRARTLLDDEYKYWVDRYPKLEQMWCYGR